MTRILNARICKNMPWEDRPEGCFLPVWRYSNNPIIKRNVNRTIERTFNSGFVLVNDNIELLHDLENKCKNVYIFLILFVYVREK